LTQGMEPALEPQRIEESALFSQAGAKLLVTSDRARHEGSRAVSCAPLRWCRPRPTLGFDPPTFDFPQTSNFGMGARRTANLGGDDPTPLVGLSAVRGKQGPDARIAQIEPGPQEDAQIDAK
jgi:hypothetical protein